MQSDGPFGVRMPDLAGRWAKRYPAPLLEAAWVGLILAAVAVVEAVGPDRPRPGARVLGVVAAYAVGRIVIGADAGIEALIDAGRDAALAREEGVTQAGNG